MLVSSPSQVFGQSLNDRHQAAQLSQTADTAASSDDEEDEQDTSVDTWLQKERIIFVSGMITPELAQTVNSQLLYLNAQDPKRDIYLYINSVGGEITSGLAIYDTMRSLRANVVTVCLGEASSMASLLLAGGTPGKRVALPHSRIMIHQPWTESGGQASDIAIQAKEILYLKNLLNRLLADLTGQPLKRIEVDTDRDFFMSAQEAKTYGLVDQVRKQPPSKSQP